MSRSAWSQGVPLGHLRELCDYWAEGYDWRATEARLGYDRYLAAVLDDSYLGA